MTSGPSREVVNDCLVALCFVPPNGCGNSIDVEVVRPADLFTELVELFDDGVAAFHVTLPDGNSSGVQIIGGCKSEERQIASMLLRMAALLTTPRSTPRFVRSVNRAATSSEIRSNTAVFSCMRCSQIR